MNVIGISGLHHSVPFKKSRFPDLTAREYRICQGFDSAAALVTDRGIEAAASEERFTREKTTGAFPVRAIEFCLRRAGLKAAQIDLLAHGFSYEPLREYFQADEYVREQFDAVYGHERQLATLREAMPGCDWESKYLPVPHHLAHATSAFFPSGFERALILVTDGMGEVDSMTVAVGNGREIEVLKTVPALHSLGVLYGAVTLYLGFSMNLDEYKVMGLAPYGDSRKYFGRFMDFIQLKSDGSYTIPLLASNRTLVERETHRGVIDKLVENFGPAREAKAEMTQEHKDIAAGLQAALQATLLHTLRHFKKETGMTRLCMAGGVALNCSANGVIKRSRIFTEMFVQPAAGDDGTALGAALYAQNLRNPNYTPTAMTLPLWGPEYTDDEVAAAIAARPECVATRYDDFDALVAALADRIVEGRIVSWFQGRMEYGPRALGSRSILADPRDPAMRNKVNWLIKKREGFRPFAPAVAADAVREYFEVEEGEEADYAHMLYVLPVKKAYREKLPAITHVDGSARIQTVTREHNPRFWRLIDALGERTGIRVVLNTSFNVMNQPIVCSPTEAVETFLDADLDSLAIGNYLVLRRDQG